MSGKALRLYGIGCDRDGDTMNLHQYHGPWPAPYLFALRVIAYAAIPDRDRTGRDRPRPYRFGDELITGAIVEEGIDTVGVGLPPHRTVLDTDEKGQWDTWYLLEDGRMARRVVLASFTDAGFVSVEQPVA